MSIIINKSENFLEATEQYLIVIASCLCKKIDPRKEPILAEVINRYPYANVYESGHRPRPGSFKLVGDGLKRRYIILVYSQIYPSKMDYPRDNKRKRLEWFVEALDQIAEIEDLKSLCFPRQIARDGGGNWSDYYLAISDFAQTLQLKCEIPVAVYDNSIGESDKDKLTQISLINCINLDTSVSLDQIVFTSDVKQIKVDREKLTFKPKKIKQTADPVRLKECVENGRHLVLEEDEAIKEDEIPNFPATSLNPDWKTPLTKPNVDPSWDLIFKRPEVQKKLLVTHKLLVAELEKYGNSNRFLPEFDSIFKTFQLCKLDDLKVVILGQDPYPNPNHAMGLSFSVPEGADIPRSLNNIFKELKNEYENYEIPKHGNLESWVKQGVLLLNSALTIRGNARNSHQAYWKDVTNLIIQLISEIKEKPVVFMLWGRDARNKAKLINSKKHLILESNHPSPMSAHRGFFGCNHFIMCNKRLTSSGLDAVHW